MTDHYARLDGLFAELGEIDGLYCPGNIDFTGWYNSQTGGSPPWDGRARPWALPKEYPTMRKEVDRVLYSTVNYVPRDWFIHAWRPFRWGDNGRAWKDETSPMPGYGDIGAYAPFADIDLEDHVKKKRPGGKLAQVGEFSKADIETALAHYIDAFAELAGGRSHVYALDSVGGAYVMLAPTTTAPIADAFGPKIRAVVFGDMMGKLDAWLEGVAADVGDRVPDVAGVFAPDLLNNKNRLYKAPLSLHSSLDGVVTPLDVDAPRYDFTPVADVDGDLIADTEAWAEGYTADHTEAVESIVATLWPDHYADADGWRGALLSRAGELRAAERERQKSQSELEFGLDSLEDLPEDMEYTDDMDIVLAKIDALDARRVVRRFCAEFDTAPGRDPPRFRPGYRSSDTGQSCFVNAEGKIVDLNDRHDAIGPVSYVAREMGYIGSTDAHPEGTDWWKTVNALRKAGFDIPRYTGQRGTHPDALGLFDEPESEEDARRQALRAIRASEREA